MENYDRSGQKLGTFEAQHGPRLTEDLSDDGVVKADKQFALADAVTELLNKLPPFDKQSGTDIKDLPELGPYKYHVTDMYAGVFFSYLGQYYKGARHGFGIETDMWGQIYEGFWNMDQKEGRGRMIYRHGAYYEGHWKWNIYHGHGKYVDVEGKVFERDWNPELNSQSSWRASERHVIINGNPWHGEVSMGLELASQKVGSWVNAIDGKVTRKNYDGPQGEGNSACSLV